MWEKIKSKGWKFWLAIFIILGLIGGIGQALGIIEKPKTETVAEGKSSVTENSEAKEPAESSEKTSGGIDYGHAVQACDDAAKEQLFPGLKYNSNPIIGEQKSQVGLDDSQFLAIYNVKVDGRKTAITCLVDGTVDDINVVSVKETEWK